MCRILVLVLSFLLGGETVLAHSGKSDEFRECGPSLMEEVHWLSRDIDLKTHLGLVPGAEIKHIGVLKIDKEIEFDFPIINLTSRVQGDVHGGREFYGCVGAYRGVLVAIIYINPSPIDGGRLNEFDSFCVKTLSCNNCRGIAGVLDYGRDHEVFVNRPVEFLVGMPVNHKRFDEEIAPFRQADAGDGGASGSASSDGSPHSNTNGQNQGDDFADGRPKLKPGPLDRLFSGLGHAPLFTQIGFIAGLWALAIGPIFFGFGYGLGWLWLGEGRTARGRLIFFLGNGFGWTVFALTVYVILNLP